VRQIKVAERRARLGWRHRLASGAQAGDPVEVARSVVAVHSTDPSSVYLSLLARMTGGGLADVQRALYEDKTLIRLLGMRRTVFVTTLDIAPVIQAACSRAVATRERRKLLSWLAESGVGDDVAGWLAGAEQAALSALAARGEATAAELAGDDPRLQVQITLSRGKSYDHDWCQLPVNVRPTNHTSTRARAYHRICDDFSANAAEKSSKMLELPLGAASRRGRRVHGGARYGAVVVGVLGPVGAVGTLDGARTAAARWARWTGSPSVDWRIWVRQL